MTIHGGEELAARLSTLPFRRRRKEVLAALIAGGEPIRLELGRQAPRSAEAPHLADSMTTSVAKSPDPDTFVVAVGPSRDAFWGFFQEWGTRHHGAQPFARPAFRAKAPEALGIVGDRLWTSVRTAAGTGSAPSPSGSGL